MNQTPGRNHPDDFNGFVAAIVASDLAEPRTRHIDAGSLPNRDTVIEVIKLLRELLFPGYFGRQHLTSSTLEYHVEEVLRAIDTKLFEQARNAIRHQATRTGVPCPDADRQAEEVVLTLLGAIPRLRAILATDVQASS
jgi:serine O-acetyltransferase